MFEEFIIALILTAVDSSDPKQMIRMWEQVTKHSLKYGILVHRYFGVRLLQSIAIEMKAPSLDDIKDIVPQPYPTEPYVWNPNLFGGVGAYT